MITFQEIKNVCLERVSPQSMQLNFEAAQEQDSAIRNMFREVLGTDKLTRKVFRRHQVDIFEITEEIIDQTIVDSEYRKSDFFNNFVEAKYNNVGDTNSFYIPSNSELRVARKSRGNWSMESQRIDVGTSVQIPMSTVGVKIYEEWERFISGRCDFPALVAKLRNAIDKYINQLVYDEFVTALSCLPTILKHNGAYAEDPIATVIEAVEAANDSTAFVLGTKRGLAKIQATSNLALSNDMMNEMNKNGYLKDWKGTVCMELPQGFKAGSLIKVVDGKEVPDFIFDDNTLFVLTGGEKPVKLYYEGSEMSRESNNGTENEDKTVDYNLDANVAVGVTFNKLFGLIKLV